MPKILVFTALFLTPLIFSFSTRELFEFPKMIFIYGLALIAVFILSLSTDRPPILAKNRLTKALIPLLLAYTISTVFSMEPKTSLFGYYTRFNGGLFSILSFTALFLLTKKFLGERTVREAAIFVIVSSLFVSIYSVLQHFGLDKNFWVQDSQARAFSTLGQPNWLAAYLLMTLPLPIFFLMNSPNQIKRLFYFSVTLLSYSGIWFSYSLSGFLALIFLIPTIFFLFERQLIRKNWRLLSLLIFLCLTLSVSQPGIFGVRINSAYRNLTSKLYVYAAEGNHAESASEIDTSSIRIIVWKGALNLFRASAKNSLIGTGPETFAYAFLPFRPKVMNQTSEWDFLYNKPHNYYLDLLTGVGILGTSAYLLFSLAVIKIFADRKESSGLSAALFSGWLTLFITNFFGWPTVSTSLLFFLYPAFIEVLCEPKEIADRDLNLSKQPVKPISLIFAITTFLGLLAVAKMYFADVYFARAMIDSKRGRFEEADLKFIEAVKGNYWEPSYHREYAFNLSQEAVNSGDEKLAAELVNLSQREAATAYRLNPKNSLTLKSLLRTYYILAKISPELVGEAIFYAGKIIAIAPTEPRSFYDTALILYQLDQRKTALTLAQKAVRLKPNYEEAKAFILELEKLGAENDEL